MRRKGTKRRIGATLMAVMLLAASGVTAFAKTATKYDAYTVGTLSTWLTEGTRAVTETQNHNGERRVFVSLAEEYMSSVGNMYSSSPVTKKGTGAVSVTYMPTGRFVSAWSSHGVVGKDYANYL